MRSDPALAAAYDCFADAFRAGAPWRLVLTHPGEGWVSTYDVEGGVILVEHEQDGVVERLVCRTLIGDDSSMSADECEPAP